MCRRACFRLPDRNLREMGHPPHFTIYDEDARLQLVKECMRELDMTDRTWTPASLVQRISAAKNQMVALEEVERAARGDRKSTRLNSSHGYISYAVFCLKKKNKYIECTSQINV